MGWLGAIGSLFTWLGGDSILATVTRLAIGIGLAKLINRSNESSTSSSSSTTPQGSRQQIPAATDNKIPVAYGDSYFSGTVTDIYSINSNKELFAVLTLCEKTGDIFSSNPTAPGSRIASSITIDDIFINNQRVTFKADGTTIAYTTDDTGVQDTNLDGLVGIYLFNGNSNYPMLPCVTGTTTPIAGTLPPAAYEIIPDWDNSYLNQNTVFVIVKMNYDPSKGAHSIPSIKFHVRNTLNKPGDVLHDYMTNLMYGMKMSESMVDNDSITALNSFSDETITLGAYPAQPRYRINGLVRTSESVWDNAEKIAAAAGSVLSYDVSSGKWSIVINKATAMSRQFDDSNIIGAVKPSVTSLDAFYNAVEVQFPYKVLKDQYNYVRFDLPEIYQNANEQKNVMQITHEFVNDVVQATVLANLDLRQSRENLSVTFKTDFSQYDTQVGEVIGVSSDVYGWTDKLFKVIKVKRVESDDGQLTIEITGQSYNEDVYSVEDITDFVPLIGAGHSLPSITPIATPVAPLVSSTTLSSQPAIFISGTVPTGIVTEMEYWYTNSTDPDDNARPYILLGTMRNENGGPFDTGVTSTFKTVLLASGTYRFKVRAANMAASSTSKFSPPSDPLAYVYTQAPDVLKYSTPTVADDGTDPMSAAGGLSMGLMAAYLATKLNWFGPGGILSGNANIANVFGISSSQVSNIATSAAADKAVNTVTSSGFQTVSINGTQSFTSPSNQNINFVGGDAVTITAPGNNTIRISVNTAAISGNTTGNTGNVTNVPGADGVTANATHYTSTLQGKVFPALYGSGPNTGEVDSRAGIFAHDYAVIGGSGTTAIVPAGRIAAGARSVAVEVRGTIQHFYNFPSLTGGSWSQTPNYPAVSGTDPVNDGFTANTSLTLYYTTCSYTSGSLDQQSWSAWKKVNSDNGVTGTRGNVTTWSNVWTNSPPTVTNAPYIVDEIWESDAVGYDLVATLDEVSSLAANVMLLTDEIASLSSSVKSSDGIKVLQQLVQDAKTTYLQSEASLTTLLSNAKSQSEIDDINATVGKTVSFNHFKLLTANRSLAEALNQVDILQSKKRQLDEMILAQEAQSRKSSVEDTSYDPFKANVLQCTSSVAYIDTLRKDTTLVVNGNVNFTGGATDLIMFGTSPFNLPDNTPFANNTVFGHVAENYYLKFSFNYNFRQLATNGSVVVGITTAGPDYMFYSEDQGKTWKRVAYDAQVTGEQGSWLDNPNDPNDIYGFGGRTMPSFKFVNWDGSKFIAHGAGETVDGHWVLNNRVATSTDGINWIEPATGNGLDQSITHVIAQDGKYLAMGIDGVQTSSDGVSWGALTLDAAFAGRGPTCGVWDGSQFVVGARYSDGQGAAMLTSANGSSWTKSQTVSNPFSAQNMTSTETAVNERALRDQNTDTVSVLP